MEKLDYWGSFGRVSGCEREIYCTENGFNTF